jgi:hypothetical protein
MRILSLVAVASLVAGATLSGSVSASAQSDAVAPHNKIFGYQDKNGAFHPLMQAEPDVTTPALAGTYEVTITITLKTPVPAGGSVLCTTDITAAAVNEATQSGNSYDEQSYSVAKVSGSTATCTVTTPYSWVLPAASSTVFPSVTGSYTVSLVPASSNVPVVELEGRTSTASFLNANKLPAAGAVSKYAIAATL